jgi:hypothetical protein
MNTTNGAEPPQMTASVQVVTPEQALAWLTNAARNRHIADTAVRRYGADMETGRWKLNGQTIVFDANGKLVDGRHRLTAIVATQVEVPMLVVWGADPEAFETMDSGRVRSLADTLGIEGRKYASNISATARIVFAYVAGVNLKFSATRSELLDLIRRHPVIETYASMIASRDHLIKGMGVPKTSLAAVLAVANDAGNRDQDVKEFIDGFITGEGLFKGDPRLTLRRWLAKMRSEVGVGGGRVAEPFFAATVKAWSAFANDNDLTNIRLPQFFNRETLPIEGFDRKRWGDVPDLGRFSFAALGAEPLKEDDPGGKAAAGGAA